MVDKVERGNTRRFEVYITDLSGNAQDPDTCTVQFFKQGMYTYDSPSPKYPCVNTGDVGYWGADVFITRSMTLGDWLAEFDWVKNDDRNGASFGFIVKEARRPHINRDPRTITPNVKVVE